MKTRWIWWATTAMVLTTASCMEEEVETTAATSDAPSSEPKLAEAGPAPTKADAPYDFERVPFTDGRAQFERVRELLEERYYRDIDEDALWGAAVQGMLEYVDPPMTKWNKLLTPAQMKALEQDLSGSLVGVGVWIEVDEDTGLAYVRAPLPGSPSERGGVKAGDILVKVDGRSCRGWSLAELVGRIRGEAGSEVTLTALREGDLVELTLKRERIDMPSVEAMLLPERVAMISIDSFNEKTTATAEEELVKLRDAGATSLVLDLRHNRGGALEHAVATADLFLPRGAPILTKHSGRGEGGKEAYVAEREATMGETPVIVLIDGETSSGAEFVALALHEAGATLIGERTRGKWSAQWLEKLDNGYGVKLTAALIEGADGKRYEGVGVSPDLLVQGPEQLGRGTALGPAERLAADPVLRTARELAQRTSK